MNLLLPYQRFIACSDGLIRGDSSKDHLPDGTPYWVRPIDGPPMPGTFVLVVARRGWMGPNKRLVKNFIVKKVESIEEDGRVVIIGTNKDVDQIDSTEFGPIESERIVGEVVPYFLPAFVVINNKDEDWFMKYLISSISLGCSLTKGWPATYSLPERMH